MKRVARVAGAGIVTGALLAAIASSACSSSTCPFAHASSATIDPPEDCLDAKVSSCLHATLTVKNNCTQSLYLSTDYGSFPNAKPGQEVEVLPASTITYEVLEDKATSKTSDREDYTIPGRVGPQAIKVSFFITKS